MQQTAQTCSSVLQASNPASPGRFGVPELQTSAADHCHRVPGVWACVTCKPSADRSTFHLLPSCTANSKGFPKPLKEAQSRPPTHDPAKQLTLARLTGKPAGYHEGCYRCLRRPMYHLDGAEGKPIEHALQQCRGSRGVVAYDAPRMGDPVHLCRPCLVLVLHSSLRPDDGLLPDQGS